MVNYSMTTAKLLFGRADNHCAFPEYDAQIILDDDIVVGEVCHIHSRRPLGPRYNEMQSEKERDSYNNLIILCRYHHKLIDAKHVEYTVEKLLEMKTSAEAKFGRPARPSDAKYAKLLMEVSQPISVTAESSNVAINSPNVVQNSVFHIKTSRKTVSINAPADSIGANGDATRYVEYLIKRYNDYAKQDTARSRPFSFAAIRKNIEKEFGALSKLVPMLRFEELCGYLQTRIAKTRIAKNNNAKGMRAFSTFAEFKQKHPS